MLCARLPPKCSPAEQFELPETSPLDARTWSLRFGSLGSRPAAACLKDLAPALGGDLDNVFVQFRMDSLGRHEYVCLGEVLHRLRDGTLERPLTVIFEDQVKDLRQRLPPDAVSVLNASRPELQLSTSALGLPGADVQDSDLCPPRGLYRNYSICEDLTLGPTQRIMLSDETTLHGGVEKNGIKIFNYLSLIVNCHESVKADRPGKYNVGTAKPRVIFQPIHELMMAKPDVVCDIMDRIQNEMWKSIQEGSIAVHCLAGVHRAPTVVVCHYLFRYYTLGHTHLCNDVEQIYKRLRAVRPAVEPLSYIVLIRAYHKFVMDRASRSRGSV